MTTTTTLPYSTEITMDDVRSLRRGAAEAGDTKQVKICDRAINGSKRALAECKRVINDARAMAY